jgi:Ca2+-transporting ATPase
MSAEGLSDAEAARRLAELGPNEIAREDATPWWSLLLGQFKSPVILLLIGACLVAGALGEVGDTVAILAIVLLNGFVGFFQEHRAERAVLALRAMTAPRARVRREGRLVVIPATEVVVGDVLVLEEGDVVAADGTLEIASELETNEAALTGESLPVDKTTTASKEGTPIAEQHERVFMGTSVAAGSGSALVTATGMRTELGRIAGLLTTAEEGATPLQIRLAKVSRALLFACLAVVLVTAALGLARGTRGVEVLLGAVSLAVAAVPEGLPAMVTIALALGVQRMAKERVLVRKLPAVETLGCVTVICTDKTGTLTTGEMRVREVWGPDRDAVLRAAASACDAELAEDGKSGTGDPTEIAILIAAAEAGIRARDIERENPRIRVHPFDARRKCMSIFRKDGVLYVKGAFDLLAPRFTRAPEGAERAVRDLGARGLRVLAVARGTRDEERDLELLGLVGMADPPRPGVRDSIRAARSAGITTVMITGDHPTTAHAIARELGIIGEGEPAEERVHARATPEEKLDLIRGWKAKGEVVAMTGDGVNDAPALREAHIGVAMGKGGTEVTREAADVVLTDDNYRAIVDGVRQGRIIFDNIQKSLVYLLSGNAAELLVMLGAAALGLPVPLLPLHLLWINLVTDGFPALALVIDPADGDVLARPPRKTDEPIIGAREWWAIATTGALEAALTLSVFAWALGHRDLMEARDFAFTVLVSAELFRSFAARSKTRVFFETGILRNLALLGVVTVSLLLQLGIHHVDALRRFFSVHEISLADCVLAFGLGLVSVTVLEVKKLLWRLVRRADPAEGEGPAPARA